MNLRRGFHRITLILAIIGGILGAISGVSIIVQEHDDRVHNHLWLYEYVGEEPPGETQPIKRFSIYDYLGKEPPELSPVDRFRVSLSKPGLVGLCILAGLVGASIGYAAAWIVFWFGG